MQKNGEYTGVVERLGTNGEGVIRLEGAAAFVPGCLVGERVKFKALSVKGGAVYGKLLEVYTPSPERVAPPCPVFGKCGGCQLQHMAYGAQLNFKREQIQNTLFKLGGIEAEVSPALSGGREYRYRNKLALPIGVNAQGETAVGFYAERSHRVVPVTDCPIQAEWVKQVISALYSFIDGQKLRGYSEVSHAGDLRHIVAREINGKFIFVLVATKRIDCGGLVENLSRYFSDFTLYLNINGGEGNGIFGKEWRLCHGEGYFCAEDCGIKFKAGANTFLQVNDGVRKMLYGEVVKEAADGCAVALDLYSGGGMLTAMLAKACSAAYGVEIVKEASLCADELKNLNGLQGKMFNVCGKVEEEIERVFSATEGKERVVVCDPPRKGMERSVIRAILAARPNKIVLVSCNPATLARDLGLLLGTLEERDGALVKAEKPASDYVLTRVTPFDMFPQTKWCEVVATLERKR